MAENKKVMVSGCFDLLHSGHVRFLEIAGSYGDLYVAVGSDKNIMLLKGKSPVFNEKERVYMVKSLKFVKNAFIPSGNGGLDFLPELKRMHPEIFIVNEDGDSEEKRRACEDLGMEYIVLKRTPLDNLPERSSTNLKKGLS